MTLSDCNRKLVQDCLLVDITKTNRLLQLIKQGKVKNQASSVEQIFLWSDSAEGNAYWCDLSIKISDMKGEL